MRSCQGMGVEKVCEDDTARTFEFLVRFNRAWINNRLLIWLLNFNLESIVRPKSQTWSAGEMCNILVCWWGLMHCKNGAFWIRHAQLPECWPGLENSKPIEWSVEVYCFWPLCVWISRVLSFTTPGSTLYSWGNDQSLRHTIQRWSQ